MKKEEKGFDFIDLDETSEWSRLEIEKTLEDSENERAEQPQEPEQRVKKKRTTEEPHMAKKRSAQEEHRTVKKRSADEEHRTVKKRTATTASGKKRTSRNTVDERKPQRHAAAAKTSASKKKRRKRQEELTFFDKLAYKLHKMTGMDKLVAATGALVLCVAIVTLSIFTTARAARKQVEAMVPIGEKLELLGTAGEDTLLAVADAKRGMSFVTDDMTEEETYEEKEEEESGEVNVTMTLTSMKKDLKIKFVNAKTKKLVSNVGFQVTIKDADKKTYDKEDDDKDGIIYLKDMTPGEASVTMEALIGNDKITVDKKTRTVTIKENIDYKKVDVSDEVKKESQVNAKVEDTAAQNVVEAALTDTVTWVESTKTEVGSSGGYVEIKKDNIADPGKSARAYSSFMKTTEVSGTTEPGDNPEEPSEPGVTSTPVETPTKPVTPTPPPEPTKVPEPTAIPSPAVTPSPSPTATPTPTKIVTPTPTANPATTNTKTPLKDKSGNQMYVKNSSGNYVEAKYADYYKYSTFYMKAANTQYKYTGWQDLDGKTYFFNSDGNKVTGEQVIQGAKYNFASDGALLVGSGTIGMDVSKWNGSIDWNAVKNSGVSYVIIRCGYRGSSTGAMIEDPKFKTNIAGATKAGLKVGIYFFTQAVNEVEAVEEASMTIGLIKNYRISYPVFLDVESSGGRADGLDSATRTQVVSAYCQTIRNSGYTAGVYANKTWLSQKMNASALSSYKIWLAQYNTAPTYTGKIDLWQYTSKGKVGGISGNTDMNLSYLGY